MASQAPVRMLIESGHRLVELCDDDFEAFEAALSERERRHGRDYKHYRIALYATRAVLYHLGAPVTQVPRAVGSRTLELGPPSRRRQRGPASVDGRLPRTPLAPPWPVLRCHGDGLRARPFRTVPHRRSIQISSSFADLDRRRHVEPYLSAVATAVNYRTGEPIAVSTQRQPHPGSRPHARRHDRVGLGGSTPTAAGLRPGQPSPATAPAALPASRRGPAAVRRARGLAQPAVRPTRFSWRGRRASASESCSISSSTASTRSPAKGRG